MKTMTHEGGLQWHDDKQRLSDATFHNGRNLSDNDFAKKSPPRLTSRRSKYFKENSWFSEENLISLN